ncbi:MAG: ROK family protein [Clostridia bacterium]
MTNIASSNVARKTNSKLVFSYLHTNISGSMQQISTNTSLSYSTVFRIINWGINNDYIEFLYEANSTGGRKAKIYKLKENDYFGLVIFINDSIANINIISATDVIIKSFTKTIQKNNLISDLDNIIDNVDLSKIAYIGLGLPCTIHNGIIVSNLCAKELVGFNIKKHIEDKFGLKTIVENDMKAVGLATKHYIKNPENTIASAIKITDNNFAAAFMIDGKVLHGNTGFAGEVYLMHELDVNNIIVHSLYYIRGIIANINPAICVLYTENENIVDTIIDNLKNLIPSFAMPQFIISKNYVLDGLLGLSNLIYQKRIDDYSEHSIL